jgi:hypothetical protein
MPMGKPGRLVRTGWVVTVVLSTQIAWGPPQSKPAEKAAVPERIYGVTVDRIDQVEETVGALRSLRRKPTARVVFDEDVAASEYREAVSRIHAVSFVMGEILDSQFVKKCPLEDYRKRTKEYLDTLGESVDLWEIGNEINGDWLGLPRDVAPKMIAAYELVKARKKAAVLTLYYNEGSVQDKRFEMFRWAEAQIPEAIRKGLDGVLVSFYDDDFEGPPPDWPKVFDRLGRMFPASRLGFGECGTKHDAKKADFIRRYYGMKIDHPRFVGGYFWWYFSGDMVPRTKALWTVLNDSWATP